MQAWGKAQLSSGYDTASSQMLAPWMSTFKSLCFLENEAGGALVSTYVAHHA